MKNIRPIAIIALLLLLIPVKAQVLSHATISDFSVSYKAAALPIKTSTTSPMFKGVPEAVISLKPASGVTKIYFKIMDNTTNVVIYNVSYLINSKTVTATDGSKLFENNNGVIYISSGSDFALKPYKYEITTEAKPGELSSVYSAIK